MMNGAVACLLPVVVTFDDDMSNDADDCCYPFISHPFFDIPM
jgi:hypothetical protein